MATLQFIIDAENRAGAAISQVEGQLNKLQPSFKKMAAIGTASFAAISGSMFMIGKASEEMRSTIIKGTGAAGKELEEMEQIARNVARQVPQSFQDVGQSIADISTRLGLTGDDLQQVSKDFLDFARITGSEVDVAVRNVTRLMGDWGIESDNTTELLDKLTVASQVSGANLDNLTNLAVNYGVQFRTVGFEIDEVVAMLAKFEVEGVATEKMMAGLSMALGRLAQAGYEPAEGFEMLIESIKTGKTEGDAMRDAIEILGSRAGPDFAMAVREGRFELDDYMKALSNTEGALKKTAKESMTSTEKMAMLRNELSVALIPVAEQFMEILTDVMERIVPLIDRLREWIDENPKLAGTIMKAALAISGIIAVVGVLGMMLIPLKAAIIGIGVVMGVILSPIGLVIAAIIAIIAVGYYWVKNWEDIKETLAFIWEMIWQAIKDVWESIIELFTEVWNGIKAIFGSALRWIIDAFMRYHPIGIIISNWEAIRNFFASIWETIKGLFSGAFTFIWNGITNWLDGIWTSITSAFEKIRDFFQSIWDGIASIFKGGINALIGLVEGMINRIINGINAFINTLNRAISRMNQLPGIDVSRIPTLSTINLPKLAEGGIITKPTTAIVGEAGPEAVIPLNRMRLAPVTVNINGGYYLSEDAAEEIGDTIIDKLKREMKL